MQQRRTGVDPENLIAEFMTLVSIGSPSRQEGHVAAYIRGVAEELGFTVEEDDAGAALGGDCGNLIIRVPGDDRFATVLMMAHMDTVTPAMGIVPIRDGERIRSDGTTVLGADDKAGVAGLLHMLGVLCATQETRPPLEIVFTVCEEVGLLGAKALDTSKLHAEFGFAFDSSGPIGFAVAQGPAQAKLHAVVHGRSAHAGVAPEKGVSAIVVAAEAIANMPLGRIDAQTTANIGKIAGGQATNIVCDRVDIFAEARSLSAQRLAEQREAMSQVLEETAARHGVAVDLEWQDSYPGLTLHQGTPLRRIVEEAMNSLGIVPSFGSTGGGSDANVIAGKGIPVANLAIGYQQIHTLDEWIATEDLVKAAELMVQIVRQCAKPVKV